jgi:hypothetical protein
VMKAAAHSLHCFDGTTELPLNIPAWTLHWRALAS